jgi:hypothetical protein
VLLGSEPPGGATHEYQLFVVFQPHTLPPVHVCVFIVGLQKWRTPLASQQPMVPFTWAQVSVPDDEELDEDDVPNVQHSSVAGPGQRPGVET